MKLKIKQEFINATSSTKDPVYSALAMEYVMKKAKWEVEDDYYILDMIELHQYYLSKVVSDKLGITNSLLYVEMDKERLDEVVPEVFEDADGKITWREYLLPISEDFRVNETKAFVMCGKRRTYKADIIIDRITYSRVSLSSDEFYKYIEEFGVDNSYVERSVIDAKLEEDYNG